MRQFPISTAVRSKVPLFIGIVGAPGSGKTKSALRLATGIQKVVGGKIGYVDTEAGRALHHAPKAGERANPYDKNNATYEFEHLDFRPPFSSHDYYDAISTLKERGCCVVVVDSMTHEHTGIGGVLEQYEKAVKDLMERWKTSEGKVGQSAWKIAKDGRKRLLNDLTQMNLIVIFCFRAKEGVDFTKKGADMDQGWEPEGGKEIFYEMMMTCLLPPRSKGVPVWNSTKKGEDFSIKLPGFLAPIFADSRSLDEKHGEQLASWAMGGLFRVEEPKPATPVSSVPAQTPKAEHPADEFLAGVAAEPQFDLDGQKPKSPAVRALELTGKIAACNTKAEVLAYAETIKALPEEVRSLVAPVYNEKKNSFPKEA